MIDEFKITLSSAQEEALLDVRYFALSVLHDEDDPTDSNLAIELAERIAKATAFLVE